MIKTKRDLAFARARTQLGPNWGLTPRGTLYAKRILYFTRMEPHVKVVIAKLRLQGYDIETSIYEDTNVQNH